jgi:hypothetical protein
MPRPRVQQAPDYPSSHGHLLQFSVQKKIQVTKEKKKKGSQNHPFLPQNSEHVYPQRCDLKKQTQSTAAQTSKESDVRILRCNGKEKHLLKEEEGKREKERERDDYR